MPALAALGALLAFQLPQATVTGVVRDAATGATLAGAAVQLPDRGQVSVTDAAGRYVIANVPPGPHHLTVRFIGYALRSLHAIAPREGPIQIDVELRPLPVQLDAQEVRAPPNAGTASEHPTGLPGRELSAEDIRRHPLLAEPDVFEALGGGEIVVKPESPAGVHIRGASQDQTAYLLDGIPVFSPYHAGGVFSAINPDAIGRVYVASAPPPAGAHALAGAVELSTRAPAARLQTQGAVTNTHARLTIDGPLGFAGATFLASLRSGFAGRFAPKSEASYLKGGTEDGVLRLEAPLLGGRFRLLGFISENEINVAGGVPPESGSAGEISRHQFDWRSQSLGGEWRRHFKRGTVRALGWSSTGGATADWADSVGPTRLASFRHDFGALASVDLRSDGRSAGFGVRLEQVRTAYDITADSAQSWSLHQPATLGTVFAHYAQPLGTRLELALAASVTTHRGAWYPGPRVQLRWHASQRVVLTANYARLHQFAQSLRNPESLAGMVFPADLYVATGAGVPVARADQAIVAAEMRPTAGVELGVQAYHRASDGLVLAAPAGNGPFSTAAFSVGSGLSSGVSVSVAMSAARYSVVARYGLQRVRLRDGTASYTPDNGTTQLIDGGISVFPSATSSVRLGFSAGFGRRGTAAANGLEWEACNLLDRGCEFAGSPRTTGSLGASRLPAYLRVDLGLRKHWHLHFAGREATVAAFGTLTNVLARGNVLAWVDMGSGSRSPLDMRPRGPLLIGLDWQF